MGLRAIGAIVVAAAVALAAGAADAATTKPKQTKVVAAKPKGRVIVTKRSYIDAGTEPNPGERSYHTDVVFPPGYNPWRSNNIDPMNSFHFPLPDSFWLPGSPY